MPSFDFCTYLMWVCDKKVNNKRGTTSRRQKIIGKTRVPFSIWRRMCILYDNVHVSIWYSLPSVNHKSEANGCNSLDNCNRCKIDVMQIGTMHIASNHNYSGENLHRSAFGLLEAKYCDSEEFPMGAKQKWEKFRFKVNVVFCNLNCLASHERANDEEKKDSFTDW